MKQKMQAKAVEILSVTGGKAMMRKASGPVEEQVVLITFRPDPANSASSEMIAITRDQAERLREDITTIFDKNLTWSD